MPPSLCAVVWHTRPPLRSPPALALGSLPCRQELQGLPGYRLVSMSRMPWSPTPRWLCQSRLFFDCTVLPSDGLKPSAHLTSSITGLNPFNLSAYGLRACWPTLRGTHYCLPPKVSLLGGWLGLPRWASHPLDYSIFPGRIQAGLPRHHGDPFDRLLVAQAMVEQVSIVSADANMDAYGITRLW